MATLNSSTPRTWTSSETVTAAMLNEELSSNFNATVAYLGTDYKSDTSSSVFTMALPALNGSTHHKHVRIVGQARTETAAQVTLRLQFNGITSSVYSYSFLQGIGAASSGSQAASTSSAIVGWSAGSTTLAGLGFAPFDITLSNVASTNWKSWVSEASLPLSTASGGLACAIFGGVMQSTISTTTVVLLFNADGSKFSSGSRASLYWIP